MSKTMQKWVKGNRPTNMVYGCNHRQWFDFIYESGPKWTVQRSESRRSVKWTLKQKCHLSQSGRSRTLMDGHSPFWTVQFLLFRSTSLRPLDRPLSEFRTVHFRRPSTFSLLDCLVSVVWTAKLNPHGPST